MAGVSHHTLSSEITLSSNSSPNPSLSQLSIVASFFKKDLFELVLARMVDVDPFVNCQKV